GGDGLSNYSASAHNSTTNTWYTSAPYTGANTYVFINVPVGYYDQIKVSDAADPNDGRDYTFGTNITIGSNSPYCPANISFTITANNASDRCPGTNDGSITVTVSGGDGSHNYVAYADNYYHSAPSPGSTILTINGLQAGDYTPVS